MPTLKWKSDESAAAEGMAARKDPYEVLGVLTNATDQEIKSSYRRMALKYHPDKNANAPKAADMFKEVTFSYVILLDPEKRWQYDTAGFEAVESESQEKELDLSSLGAVNTMFAALFSKLGVPIKPTVSVSILEEALHGDVNVCSLPLGQPVRTKLLYFDQEENRGLSLALQEESSKAGKMTSNGMYFFGFHVYKLDKTSTSMAASKDPGAAFFKKLLQDIMMAKELHISVGLA